MDFFKKKIDFFLKKSQTNAPIISYRIKVKESEIPKYKWIKVKESEIEQVLEASSNWYNIQTNYIQKTLIQTGN
jgi:hypothetical protein